ncbi:MAG TPA: amidohydrolase family protein [Chloroflexota bacterium]|nr:amidohydrolase family protein [Chloroflexota bacterium]
MSTTQRAAPGAAALRQRLLGEAESLATVDCHSHTVLRQEYAARAPLDLFRLGSYFERDIGGLTGRPSAELYAGCADDAARWARLRGVLARARNVSYWRHNVVTYQGLFDLDGDDVGDDNWAALNERIKARTAEPDWYDRVTRERCNLITQVRNVPWYETWEPQYFTAVLRMEPALRLHDPEVRRGLQTHLGRELGDLAAARRGLADLMADYAGRGAIGIKLAHAYFRSLRHEPVPEATAAPLYARAVAGEALAPGEVTALQDHIVWYLTGLAGDMGLIFQIHTGMQGNWGHVPDSNPLDLLELIRAHRSVRFDLFHAGYPYARELGVVGKHYPNVWLNACWIYLITMAGSRQILSEWIDLVPAERLLGFGSDVQWPELVYGHLVMARACLADVLAEKVQRDFLSATAASDLMRLLLRDAPVAFYGLPADG